MEKNENQPFMNSVREAAAQQDNSKLEFLIESAKINDSITTPNVFHLKSPVFPDEENMLSAPPTLKKSKLSSIQNKSSPFKTESIENSSPRLRKITRTKEVDVFHSKDKKKVKRFLWLSKILDSKIFNGLISLFTLYALFGDDFRIICTMKSTDHIFDGFTFTCFAFFVIEIFLSILVKKNYLFSFFFWLDIISTVSLIIDITFINEQIFGDSSSNQNFAKKAGKASQIGTRTGRIIRLVRLIRIVKLYKTYQENLNNEKVVPTSFEETFSNKASPLIIPKSKSKKSFFSFKVFSSQTQQQINNLNNNPLEHSAGIFPSPGIHSSIKDYSIDNPDYAWKDQMKSKENTERKESRVGKKLSDLTMKRVIIIVLILVFFVPMFSSSYFAETDYDFTIQLKIMTQLSDQSQPSTNEILQIYEEYISDNSKRSNPVVYCSIPSISKTFQSIDPQELRNQEKQELSYTLTGYSQPFVSTISIRDYQIYYSMMNIFRTIFVCIVLALASYFFTKDVNDLALKPIERMIIKVNKIASNPLATNEQAIIFSSDKMQYETSIIENAITKIGVLLALGFGEAGSEIIALNIAQTGDVDPMIPGKKRFSVFGFCDIRNFTDATEVLQQEVMVFVNSIAFVVHKTVDKFGGIANKNIGDAFLLVWKFPEEEIETLEDGSLTLKKNHLVKNIADLSIISFAKIIAGINKKESILKYRENAGLKQRIPNYKVKMGFGLHLGWAIEGAIGSEYKIDASYLSPNVNLASRLEAATKQYGVPLLISHELHQYFSKKTRNLCREIDRVTVKGSKKPLGLFTLDLQQNKLILSQQTKKKDAMKRKINHINAKGNILELAFSSTFKCSLFFDMDNDLMQMTNEISTEFLERFADGYQNYIKGLWMEAKERFTECLVMSPEDGPSHTLMKFMEESLFVADKNWAGFRELTEK